MEQAWSESANPVPLTEISVPGTPFPGLRVIRGPDRNCKHLLGKITHARCASVVATACCNFDHVVAG